MEIPNIDDIAKTTDFLFGGLFPFGIQHRMDSWKTYLKDLRCNGTIRTQTTGKPKVKSDIKKWVKRKTGVYVLRDKIIEKYRINVPLSILRGLYKKNGVPIPKVRKKYEKRFGLWYLKKWENEDED